MPFHTSDGYESLSAHDKLRDIFGLPYDASDEDIIYQVELLAEKRTGLQNVVLDVTRLLRAHLHTLGYDDITRPKD